MTKKEDIRKKSKSARASKNERDEQSTAFFETLVNEKRGNGAAPVKVQPAVRDTVYERREERTSDENEYKIEVSSVGKHMKPESRTSEYVPEYSSMPESEPVYNEPEDFDNAAETEPPEVVPTLAAIIAAACLAVSLLLFAFKLIKLNVLPTVILIAVLFFAAAICVAIVSALWSKRRPVRFALGILLSVLAVAGLGYGSFMFSEAYKTAKKVTTVEPVTTVVGVYVKADDPAVAVTDTAGSTYGVLKTSDREDTDQALQMIANDLGSAINVAEYENVTELILAVSNGNVRAGVFEAYHIEMLQSMEQAEYIALAAGVRELCSYTVEKRSNDADNPTDVGESPIQLREETEEDANDNVFTVYISGIDTYGSVNVQSRSDVNIIGIVNTETHQVLLVTTPRDYYVYTPVSGQYKDKLTHAGLWGPECSMGALEYLYDVNIDYYFRLNFSGFVKIIDALGGIDFSYTDDGRVVHLAGSDALTIARDRTLCGSDFNRGINQTRIIKCVIKKMLSPEMLSNFSGVMDAVNGSFETTVPYDFITDMVKEQLSSNPDWEIFNIGAQGTGTSAIPYAFRVYGNESGLYAYVCEPDSSSVNQIQSLIKAMKNDERISDPNA